MALSLTDVNSITNRLITPRGYDTIFKYSPVLVRMRTRQNFQFTGGTSIDTPITYAKLKGGPFTRGQALNIDYVNTETAFSVKPKFYYVSVVLFGTDGVLNRGEVAAMSLVELKLANAAMAMGENLAIDMYLDGLSTAAVNTNLGANSTTSSLDGFAQWIDDGSNVSTVGSIARADIGTTGTPGGGNAYFRNFSNAPIATPDLNTAFSKAWFGPDRPDLLTANTDVWTFIVSKLQPSQRFERQDADVVKASFQAIQYMGADFVVDNYCPAGSLWGLNTRYLQFWMTTNKLFQFGFTGFKEDQGTVDYAGQYLWGGNIVYANPRSGFQLAQIGG
jgi:hypothetical protein